MEEDREIAYIGRFRVLYLGEMLGKQKIVTKSYFKLDVKTNRNYSCVKVLCECGLIREIKCKNINYKTKGCQVCGCSKTIQYSYKDIPGSFYNQLIHSTNKRKLELLVDSKYLYELLVNQNKKCSLSGLELYFKNKDKLGTASIDRIDSSKGYIKGNVQWVHKDINKLKTDFNEDYFINLCKLVSKHNEQFK